MPAMISFYYRLLQFRWPLLLPCQDESGQKQQIVIRVRLEIKLVDVKAMMDGLDIVKIRRAVGIADGNIKNLFIVLFENRQDFG